RRPCRGTTASCPSPSRVTRRPRVRCARGAHHERQPREPSRSRRCPWPKRYQSGPWRARIGPVDPLSRRDLLVGTLQALFAALFGWLLPKRRRVVPPVNGDFFQLDHPIVFERGVPIGLHVDKENEKQAERYMYQLTKIDLGDHRDFRRLKMPYVTEPMNWRFSDGDVRWVIRRA